MSAKTEITAETMRSAIQALGENGKEISYALIYEAMGIDNDAEKAVVRSRVTKMAKHGELTRTERGCFIYNFRHRPRKAPMLEMIWRFVRAAKPGWTIEECSLMTRASYRHAMRYLDWLEQEGFIARAGANEKHATLYRKTMKAQATPETPYPPIRESDPFAKERQAAAMIARLMLCADPYALKTGRLICESCRVLLARFEKNNAEIRMENENEQTGEESHVE